MLRKIEYKKYKIYFFENQKYNFKEIGKKIIDKEYKIEKIYKDTIRNYVAKININGEDYVLKSPKSENIIPQRKFFSFLKKGEALNTLLNIHEAEKKGIDEFVKVYLAIVKKEIFIKESYILMECIEGEKIENLEDIKQIVKIIKKLHKNNIYHGDLNTSNFIKTDNNIKIIDSQAKKERISSYKRWYDIFTFEEDLLVKFLGYNIEKNYLDLKKGISYYVAKNIKSLKRLKVIKKIKKIKKELREKGYKV